MFSKYQVTEPLPPLSIADYGQEEMSGFVLVDAIGKVRGGYRSRHRESQQKEERFGKRKNR